MKVLQVQDLFRNVVGRWSASWRTALACAVAAELSWSLAHHVLGHERPVFAAVAAVVCLSPGLPSHVQQGIGIIIGVTIGVGVGEIGLALTGLDRAVLVCVVTFVAMMLAITFGSAPVIAIQAGVSALLVLVLGPVTAGTARLLDVGVGTGVGLLFSQFLLARGPMQTLADVVRAMIAGVATGFHAAVNIARGLR